MAPKWSLLTLAPAAVGQRFAIKMSDTWHISVPFASANLQVRLVAQAVDSTWHCRPRFICRSAGDQKTMVVAPENPSVHTLTPSGRAGQGVDALSACKQPGGGVEQSADSKPVTQTPDSVRRNQAIGTAAGYKAQAKKDGIPYRPHGLYPPGDCLLQNLSTTLNCWPFEKHLPGAHSPYELLPQGGWITGDAASERGVDLRLFYKEPEQEGAIGGTVLGAVRFGQGASIGVGFYLSAHGGAIETALDEATAELAKIDFVPFLSTREANFAIKRPVPLHTTLLVRCVIVQRKGIRCWVDGSIESADGNEVYATCKAQLVDMTHFLK